MAQADASLQLVPEVNPYTLRPLRKACLVGFALGVLLLAAVQTGAPYNVGWAGLILAIVSSLVYIFDLRHDGPPGIKNNGIMHSGALSRGAWGWFLGVFITGFYVIVYFYPSYVSRLIEMVDPLKIAVSGQPGVSRNEAGEITGHSQWFFYGFLYTLSILVMGVRAIMKYRHSRYQILRTISVMAAQLFLAFLIPDILMRLNEGRGWFAWANIWPLNFYGFEPWNLDNLWKNAGFIGRSAVVWAVASIILVTPVLTYFYGKRWYCSWVCGCGGLAETLGDPWRQNSDKSLRAWKIERWMIHLVLVLVVVTTGTLFLHYQFNILGDLGNTLKKWYGFLIMSVFAGVIGVGFYPIMGSRVWCRFGCPMAAVLGIIQRYFSRFRITTNGGQCISCGNCSTYCEMGIDVRYYAQRGENIVRASCVGCGVCSAVCPRGVLNLENGPVKGRFAV
ncbi:MAG: 4Fe-4S binding protein [Acidobacteriota bacterium]|nr:4Fe-4S binding protein [Acidobacteriota bacterium]